MKRLILVFALFVLTLSGAYVAQKFTLTAPEGVENVKHYLDGNGNEHVSYTLAGNKVAVASIKTNLRKATVSKDKATEDKNPGVQ